MSKCENCICNPVCDHNKYGWENCNNFKDKSLCVELSCAIGITLYFLYNRPHADKPDLTPKIYETNEWYFDIDEKGITILPRFVHGYNREYHYHLGETVFLTEEKAKAKIKEIEKK